MQALEIIVVDWGDIPTTEYAHFELRRRDSGWVSLGGRASGQQIVELLVNDRICANELGNVRR